MGTINKLSRRLLLVGLALCLAHAETPPSTTHSGIVRYYKPGEEISIDIRPQVEVKYNLTDKDATYSIEPQIEVGSKVTAEETQDSNGKKLVRIRLGSTPVTASEVGER